MTIKTITVGIKRLINLGNYENVTYECKTEVEVKGDLYNEAYSEGLAFCKEKIGIELDRFDPVKPIKPIKTPQKFPLPDGDDDIPF